MKLPFKFFYTCLLMSFFTSVAFSQKPGSSDRNQIFPFLYNNFAGSLSYTAEIQKTYESFIANVEGSPFFEEQFMNATISDSNNMFKVRYNAYLDEMEIIDKDKIVFINKELQKNLISFKENGQSFKVLKTNDAKGKEILSYFVTVETNDHISLYRKDRKKYVQGNNYGVNRKAKFQKAKKAFYIETNNSGVAEELPRNKKAFAKLFQGKEKQILSHIEKNNLKLRKEADVAQVIRFINTL